MSRIADFMNGLPTAAKFAVQAVIILLTAPFACQSPVASDAIVGEFQLVEVNGDPLPYRVGTAVNGSQESTTDIVSGRIVLGDDRSYHWIVAYKTEVRTCGPTACRYDEVLTSDSDAGVFAVRGATVMFRSRSAVFRGETITASIRTRPGDYPRSIDRDRLDRPRSVVGVKVDGPSLL